MTGPSCPARLEQPKAQSPFAHLWCYRRWCDVEHHLRERYLSFFARMDSCASPTTSVCLWSTPWSDSLCRLRSAPAGQWDFPDVISANLFRHAWTSTPAARQVLLPVSSLATSAFPTLGTGRRSASLRAATSARRLFRGCSHSCLLQACQVARHPRSLLPLWVSLRPAPTTRDVSSHVSLLVFRLNPQGSRGFSIRAPYSLLPSYTSNMLVV